MKQQIAAALVVVAAYAGPATAGVTNPNISVIGQPYILWNDDSTSPADGQATLEPGELEVFFDAYLNPYARGTVVVSVGEDGAGMEEGFFELLRGLPGGLVLKGGKYRLNFGKLNPKHPHTYPFAERFRVLADYLPGDESFNETAVQISQRLPAPGDFSLTASADWLAGDTFRIERESSGANNDPLDSGDDDADRPRSAFLARLAGFAGIGDRSGLEIGVSASTGINNVAADARTTIYGADARAKLWNSDTSCLVLQGEFLHQQLDHAGWDSTTVAYTRTRTKSTGGYVYADYNFKTRYNVGGGYERYRQPVVDGPWDQSMKLWVGFSLLEESTAFRLDWDHYMPGDMPGTGALPDINTITLRAIFSMGPHKAHQF